MPSRVRSAGDGGKAALENVADKMRRHLKQRAELLSGITKDLHKNAPRGGRNVNRFGERRSAPGGVPAMETGRLFAEMDQGVEVRDREAAVIVNRTVLEMGTRNMAPRPIGSRAVAELKEKIRK